MIIKNVIEGDPYEQEKGLKYHFDIICEDAVLPLYIKGCSFAVKDGKEWVNMPKEWLGQLGDRHKFHAPVMFMKKEEGEKKVKEALYAVVKKMGLL